jgi:hypothetical protein
MRRNILRPNWRIYFNDGRPVLFPMNIEAYESVAYKTMVVSEESLMDCLDVSIRIKTHGSKP